MAATPFFSTHAIGLGTEAGELSQIIILQVLKLVIAVDFRVYETLGGSGTGPRG
jgi:hypothetical protein